MTSFLKISLIALPSLCSALPPQFNFSAIFDTCSPTHGWPPAAWPRDQMAASTSTSTATPSATAKYSWLPTAGTSWNIQLLTPPKPEQADDDAYAVWDFDLFDAPVSTIEAFHAKGRKVICYFSAGSYENWRPDANDFPKSGLGKDLDGWHGERWLDVRNAGVRDVMKKRIQLAKQKGCDGVDPDNVDGYENDTGFPLTKADSVDYVKFLAQTAHEAGLSCGLKNGGDFLEDVIDHVEWSVNEECVYYKECNLYRPMIAQNKPVFHIEYPDDKPKMPLTKFIEESCSDQEAAGFSTLVKKRSLNAWTRTCPNGKQFDRSTVTSRQKLKYTFELNLLVLAFAFVTSMWLYSFVELFGD